MVIFPPVLVKIRKAKVNFERGNDQMYEVSKKLDTLFMVGLGCLLLAVIPVLLGLFIAVLETPS